MLNPSKSPAFISLAYVITLGAILFMAVLLISMGGIDSLLESQYEVKSNELSAVSEACTEEALLQLNQDDAYVGGDFTVNGIDCSVSVSGAGGTRTMTSTASQDGVYMGGAELTIDVSANPITITNWETYFTP